MSDQTFKEAWAHDFAPPIHSLDRHGDFAPPLLALGLAAGFFGVASTDDVDEPGWRFNTQNGDGVGDDGSGWGYLLFDSFVDLSTLDDPFSIGGEWAMVEIDETGSGFLWNSNGNATMSLNPDLFEVILANGGDFTVDTVSADFPDGTVQVDGGTINIISHHDGPVHVGSDSTMLLDSDDSLDVNAIHGYVRLAAANDTIVTCSAGRSFIVLDHLGDPLVTYTG